LQIFHRVVTELTITQAIGVGLGMAKTPNFSMSEIAVLLGKKGSSQTPPGKAKAARANEKLDGRPRKKSAK
jgi:hypothetical protein